MAYLYSKKLLQPFIGVILVAELGWARALSLDGKHWALRYAQDEDDEIRRSSLKYTPAVNCSLVVTIDNEQVATRIINRFLDPQQAQADAQRLFEAIKDEPIPYNAADRFEYWLLDAAGLPLALLHSCVLREDMQLPVPSPEWCAMPAAQLLIQDPHQETQSSLPVNYRLERLVEERAGYRPRAAWFERNMTNKEYFPPLLLDQEWQDKEGRRLCELYLRRLAPRLLMLSSLALDKRAWLEQAAREHALDVERFYPLYPEVVDTTLMNAARIEARLQQASQDGVGR